jgi:hypothetical protein
MYKIGHKTLETVTTGMQGFYYLNT